MTLVSGGGKDSVNSRSWFDRLTTTGFASVVSREFV